MSRPSKPSAERIEAWRRRNPDLQPLLRDIWEGRGTPAQSEILTAYVEHVVNTASRDVIEAFMYDVLVAQPPPWATKSRYPGQDSDF